MSLRVAEGERAGAPWNPPIAGRLDTYVVDSELLAGNPLGDPARRPLYVYRPPTVARAGEGDPAVYDVPAVYVLQAFTGQLDRWLARAAFEPTIVERLDRLFAGPDATVPAAIVVFVDAWTRLGGSQFRNSTATGRYLDYLCDEVVPFIDARYPTARDPARRGLSGHSSGGHGALVAAMLRPDVFAGGIAAQAPDTLFELSYLPTFARAVRALRDRFDGSVQTFWTRFAERERFDYGAYGALLEVLACAAAFSPDPAHPAEPLLPFDPRTGVLHDAVWQRWLACDPVRMAAVHAGALRGLAHIALEAGVRDEANLDLGTGALAAELTRLGVPHAFELVDGGHGGQSHRFAPAIAALATALAER